MDEYFRALIGDFVEEAQPLVERLAEAFLALELTWKQGEGAEDILAAVKSDLHTLKGNSGLMGLTAIQSLTHSMEDLCVKVVEDPGLRNAEIIDLFLQGSDMLREMIRLAVNEELSDDYCAPLLDRLRGWIDGAWSGGDGPAIGCAVPGEGSRDTTTPGNFSRAASPDTIRIDFRKLDGLLEVVGEAMVSRSMLHESQRALRRTFANPADLENFGRIMESLDSALKRLQEGLMETRLLPVSRVFRRFSRQVRDQARETNKNVTLVTVGSNTTIDKTIIDKLNEPLLHLVRNCIAHGIESPEERREAGKPPEGTIELRAEQLADRVVITVCDDGRGLDEKKIVDRLRDMGYETSHLSSSEIHSLIFQPGFSTADDVSALAGRGVGLDVVASTIGAIGGSIAVSSEPGRGAMFRMDLPLTLAVVKALFIKIHDEVYALPLSYVMESFRLDRGTVHTVDGRSMIRWRGELLPLLDGGSLLGVAGEDALDFCVVISTGAEKCVLRVGELQGHEDVVAKSVENMIGRQELISGVTVMGDGQVVFILDAARITGSTCDRLLHGSLPSRGYGGEART